MIVPVNKKTHDTFIAEVYALVGQDYTVLSQYCGKDTKISMMHNICGKSFEMSPHNFLNGSRCPICAKQIRSEKRKITKDEFIKRFQNINPELYANIEFITEYRGMKSDITVRIKNIDRYITTTGYKLLHYKYNDARRFDYTCADFDMSLKEKNENIIRIDEYVNAKTKILFKCNICNNTFMRDPNGILTNPTCPECKKNERLATKKEYFEKVYKKNRIDFNEYIVNVDEYLTWRKKIKICHSVCGKEFMMSPHDFAYSLYSCPHCARSYSEKQIDEYLSKNGIIFETQKKFDDCCNKNRLPFDFFIPSMNTVIEYDGEFHFKNIYSNLEYTKTNDLIKNNFCDNYNINIIRIPYFLKYKLYDILDYIIRGDINACKEFISTLKTQRLSLGDENTQQE